METTTRDLTAAAAAVARVVAAARDDQITAPTPCEGMTVAGLLHHAVGFTEAFRLAARKETLDRAPQAAAEELPTDWRTRLPGQLDQMAAAWRESSAWEGTATVAGVTLPGTAMGRVALTELVVHGWDLAVATGQPYQADDGDAQACLAFQREFAAGVPRGQGLFGPEIPVADDAPVLDRLLGFTGRDPDWSPKA